MKCQYCNCLDSKVIDSRPTEEGTSIRRRRECINCGRRFTTYEKIELVPLMVVKRDGRREAFDAQKIKAGIVHACEKLPVSMNQIDAMTARIEQSAYASMEGEVTSQRIGDMVMQELKSVNDVAYYTTFGGFRKGGISPLTAPRTPPATGQIVHRKACSTHRGGSGQWSPHPRRRACSCA